MIVVHKILRDARKSLYPDWNKAIFSSILLAGIITAQFLVSLITVRILRDMFPGRPMLYILWQVICAVVSYILCMPAFVGMLKMVSRTVYGNPTGIQLVLYYYSRPRLFWRLLWLGCQLCLRVLLQLAIFTAPGILLIGFSMGYHVPYLTASPQLGNFRFTLLVVGISLLATGAICSLILSCRYFLVIPQFVQNPNVPRRELFQLSARLCRGNKLSLTLLRLSFLPLLLVSFVFPPLATYLIPYYQTSVELCRRSLCHRIHPKKSH